MIKISPDISILIKRILTKIILIFKYLKNRFLESKNNLLAIYWFIPTLANTSYYMDELYGRLETYKSIAVIGTNFMDD